MSLRTYIGWPEFEESLDHFPTEAITRILRDIFEDVRTRKELHTHDGSAMRNAVIDRMSDAAAERGLEWLRSFEAAGALANAMSAPHPSSGGSRVGTETALTLPTQNRYIEGYLERLKGLRAYLLSLRELFRATPLETATTAEIEALMRSVFELVEKEHGSGEAFVAEVDTALVWYGEASGLEGDDFDEALETCGSECFGPGFSPTEEAFAAAAHRLAVLFSVSR